MGTLYLVATPIGNLKDITLRALEVLQGVGLILCEDTRHSGPLLAHYDITAPRLSYHEHNEKSREAQVLRALETMDVALISDAGLPGISDPGMGIVSVARGAGHAVTVLPGASAAPTAVVGAGLGDGRYLFYGFLPPKEGGREKALESLRSIPVPLVFYEAPHRLRKTMESLEKVFGNRRIVLCRELTKVYEEYKEGTLAEFLSGEIDVVEKGECVLVVEPGAEEEQEVDIEGELRRRIDEGMSPSRAVKEVAKTFGLPKNRVYEVSLCL